MRENSVCRKLKAGEPVTGMGLSLGSLRAAEMVARTGFDFVMVDLLHGHFEKSSATDAIRSIARSGGPVPFARISRNEAGPINDMLDAGALGIVVPMVNSAAEAQRAVAGTYYPPLGKRSKGSAASIFYDTDYPQAINRNLTLVVMVETPEAVDHADEILSVPGIGCCLVGTGDLSFAMDQSKESPEVAAAVDHVIRAATQRGVAVGLAVHTAEEAERWKRRGALFFLATHDLSLLNDSIRRYDAGFSEFRASSER